jgi:hypothetical protein
MAMMLVRCQLVGRPSDIRSKITHDDVWREAAGLREKTVYVDDQGAEALVVSKWTSPEAAREFEPRLQDILEREGLLQMEPARADVFVLPSDHHPA